MIRFIYTSDYSTSTAEGSISAYEAEPKPLAVHASMYGPGDFYGIRSLKWVAAGELKKLIEPCSPPMRAFRSPGLLAFIQAIKVVYTTTPDEDRVPRDSVIPCIPRNLHDMFQFKEFRELVNGVPEFVEEAFDEGMFSRTRASGALRYDIKIIKGNL